MGNFVSNPSSKTNYKYKEGRDAITFYLMKLQNCIDRFRTNRQIVGKVIPLRNIPIQSFYYC